MNLVIKIKNIIIYILGGLFIINTFLFMFLYKFTYNFLISISLFDANEINNIINYPYIIFLAIFIIIIADLIFDLWYKKKFNIKITSLIVIIIFAFISIFSSPFGYLDKMNDRTYKLDNLLTIIDFHSVQNDFSGGSIIRKYLYIPFTDKIIIIDGFKIDIERLNDNNYYIVDSYYDES